jgi:[NiFe] hydrogenase diaphorase moiety large subunit
MKWEFTRAADGEQKHVLCNADEGEPGTFKDRVILTECADLVFEGMTIAGYAVGSGTGILYLRGEYATCGRFSRTCWPPAQQGPARQGHLRRERLRLRHPHPDGRRRLCLRRGDRADQLLRGAARRPEEPPAVPGPEGLSGPSHHRQQRRDLLLRARILERGPAGSPRWARRAATGTKVLSISGDCKRPGRLRGALRHHRCASCWRWRAAEDAGRCRSAGRRQMIGPTSSTGRSATTIWPPAARSWSSARPATS